MQSNGEMLETGEYLNEMKMEGCKAKEKCTRFYEILLPEFEQDNVNLISGSCIAENFTIEYKIRCFVKHNSVFEVGQGNCVEFPVYIIPRKLEPSNIVEAPDLSKFKLSGLPTEFDY